MFNLSNQVRVAWKPDSESLQDSFKVGKISLHKMYNFGKMCICMKKLQGMEGRHCKVRHVRFPN